MDVKSLFSLEGKKGFITGSTRGIGKTLAQAFIELGADVAILGTNAENAKKVAAERVQCGANCLQAFTTRISLRSRLVRTPVHWVFLTAQAAAKLMIKLGKKGSIVNTASMSAHIVNVPQTIANYNASKAGVIQLTKSLAVEWLKYGIRVNCVSPGYMQTELIATMSDMLPVWQSKMPEGSRLGYPRDLIGAYVYFVSDASEYATGSDLVVDGGYTII